MYSRSNKASVQTPIPQNEPRTLDRSEDESAYLSSLRSLHNVRCAIYARSAVFDPGLISTQISACMEVAQSKGWIVLNEYIKSDSGISGLHWAGLEGLEILLAAVETESRPFDCLVVTDRCRLSRNLDAASRIIKAFAFYGVAIFAIREAKFLDESLQHLPGNAEGPVLRSLHSSASPDVGDETTAPRDLCGKTQKSFT